MNMNTNQEDGEQHAGVWGRAREALGRVRWHVWPLQADIARELVSEVSIYNAHLDAGEGVAVAELADVAAALENHGDFTAPLRRLVAALEAAELLPMDEEDEWHFCAALERAGKLLAAYTGRNRLSARVNAPAGDGRSPAAVEATPVTEPGMSNYDPDKDPLWFIICTSLLLTLLTAIPVEDDEDDAPLEPEPLGKGAWAFNWCFLAGAAALSILFDGNLVAALAALVVLPLTGAVDLMGKQVSRAWIRQRLGWLVPVYALPGVVMVFLLAADGVNEDLNVFPPHLGSTLYISNSITDRPRQAFKCRVGD
jgi:hypothetical protein